jgi:hypothetical protein
VLVRFGLWRALSKRHFRWAGMRLSPAQLTSWSFLLDRIWAYALVAAGVATVAVAM